MLGRIGVKLLINRKRMFIILWLMITISGTLLFSVGSIQRIIQSTIFENAINKYGEQHCIYFDVEKERLNGDFQSVNIDTVGMVQTIGIGKMTGEDREATVGYLDENTIKLGRIKVLEGRMPRSDSINEIALEENTAVRFGNIDIGTKIILSMHVGEEEIINEYEVTGILDNYSANWNILEDVKRGYNDLPSIVASEEISKMYEEQSFFHMLVKFSGWNKYDNHYTDAFMLGTEMNHKTTYGMEPNYNLYMYEREKLNFFRVALYIFLGVMGVGITFTIGNIYSFVFHKYTHMTGIMKALGADKGTIIKIIIYQWLFLLICSLPAVLVLGYIIRHIIIYFFLGNPDLHLGFTFGDFLVAALVIAVSTLISVIPDIRKYLNINLIAPALQKEDKTLLHNDKKTVFRRLSPVVSMVFMNVSLRNKKMLISILSIGASIAIFCFSQLVIHEFVIVEEIRLPDYRIAPYTTSISTRAGDFMIEQNQTNFFDFNDIHVLENNDYIEFVNKIPFVQGSILVLKNQQQFDEYWKCWKQQNILIYGDNLIRGVVLPTQYYTVPEVSFVVLNEREFEVFNDEFTDSSLNKRDYFEEDIVILFLPPLKDNDGNIITTDMDTDTMVAIGRIEQNYKLSDDITSTEGREYIEFDVEVGKIIEDYFELQINDINIYSSGPTVIISEETVKRMGIFKGYEKLDVYLKDFDENDTKGVQEVEYIVKNMAAQFPNAFYSSLREEKEKSKMFENLLRITANTLTMIVGLYGLFYIILASYTRIIVKRRTYCIYRVLGISRKQLIASVYLENLFYIVLSVILGGIMALLLILSINPYEGMEFFKNSYSIISVIVLIVGQLSIILPCREAYKINIAKGLAVDE